MKKHNTSIIFIGICIIIGLIFFFSNPVYVIDEAVSIDKVIICDEMAFDEKTKEYAILDDSLIIEEKEMIGKLINPIEKYNLALHKTDSVDTTMSLIISFYNGSQKISEIELSNSRSQEGYCHIYDKIKNHVYYKLPDDFINVLFDLLENN